MKIHVCYDDYVKVRRNVVLLLMVIGVLLSTSCAPQQVQPQKTQLQIRQFQTRVYDNQAGRIKRIMKAVINVLQDDAFIIKNADKELGFITATKEVDVENKWQSAFSIFADGAQARYQKNSVIDCSVNISEFGNRVKVRAIFQTKMQDNMGGTLSVSLIDDPSFYQEFFSKVDKGIFIERQNL